MREFNIIDDKKGSAILAVLVITTSLAIVIGAILQHSVTERRINKRHEMRIAAKNASEAIAEYGFAQLRHKFDNRTNFDTNALNPATSDALGLPSQNIFGSNVDIASSEIVGGNVPGLPSSLTYIDPELPFNEFDPLKGQKVFTRTIALYAKATVTDPNGGPSIDSYTTQKLQIRDAPLFAHAIFYNLDLDLHPGPEMDIYGPVHSNQDFRVAPNDTLNFHNQVTVTGDIFHQYEHNSTGRTANVTFPDRYGSLLSMKVGGSWKDSRMGTNSVNDDFREFAADRWHGNVQSSAHDVPTYNPVAFADYVPDDPNTGAYDPINSGREIIEPPLDISDPEYNETLEAQKISNKAGLYFKWNTTTNTVTAQKEANGTVVDISHLEGSLWTFRSLALRDRRRGGMDITTIDLHMGKLKSLIETPDPNDPIGFIGTVDPNNAAIFYNSLVDWNGIIFFECYSTDANATDRAKLNHTGVRLVGGQTDQPGQGIPSLGSDIGMTFTTNNVLYIEGHFNADGDTDSTSAYQAEDDELPVAVMGDAVTFLSANYSDSYNKSYGNKPPADTTEVSAAVVSGIRPPNKQGDGSYSGGAHNFPRFLEHWYGDTFYIRGSMVCLYESEIDDSIWSTSYYYPPSRGYGFNSLFEEGIYPPGTPLLRAYRRINYTNIGKDTYNNAIASLAWNGGSGETIIYPDDEIQATPETPNAGDEQAAADQIAAEAAAAAAQAAAEAEAAAQAAADLAAAEAAAAELAAAEAAAAELAAAAAEAEAVAEAAQTSPPTRRRYRRRGYHH